MSSLLKRFLFALSLLAGTGGMAANAQPLDDVSLEFQDGGVVATIRLTGPVQYLRHFPASHGKTLEIFYERVKGAASDEPWRDDEVRKSPPSRLIPAFTVTTRDQLGKPRLVIEFEREAEFSVAPGKDNRSLLVTVRPDRRQQAGDVALPFLPAIIAEAKPAPVASLSEAEAAAAATNADARALMVQARDALAARDNEAAVEALNKLLMLPPNDYTRDAQEWIGVARERAGQPGKAKVEYDLYLRLFPDGAGAARVTQRLEGLSGAGASKLMVASAEKKQAAGWSTFGSVTPRYYFGKSKIDTTFTFNGATTTDSISLTDQSMLVTSVDASGRYRSEEYDGRLVFRDTNTRNFLADQPSQNRVSAAYGEIRSRTQNYLLRAGRQSPMGGGVLGRFDGLAASYGEPENWRANAVAGVLDDYSQGSKPRFYGASVDSGMFSFYGINQTVDGAQDRRALGTEFRYFDNRDSAYALLDYDIYFRAVNAAQFMGVLGLANNATLNFLVDHRKAPSLSIRNALSGASTSSVDALLQALSASGLRDLALARTATSNMGQLGVTLPFNEKWQVGGDIRVSNTTGLPASGTTTLEGVLDAVPARGTEKSVTGQVIGSGIRVPGDIWSGSLTLSSGTANGNTLFVYNHTQFASGWSLDTSLQLSSFKDQYGGKTTRKSPMVRGAYRLREQLYFDVDGGIEWIDFSGTQSSTATTRYFGSVGVRWDF